MNFATLSIRTAGLSGGSTHRLRNFYTSLACRPNPEMNRGLHRPQADPIMLENPPGATPRTNSE